MKEQFELLVPVGLALVPRGAAVKRARAAMMVLLGSLQLGLQTQRVAAAAAPIQQGGGSGHG